MTTILYTAYGLICFCFVLSVTDILPKRNWFRRVCTVSKLHQWWGALIGLALTLALADYGTMLFYTAIAMSLFVILNNGLSLRRYLPFYPKRIATGSRADLKLLALNVRQKNDAYDRALDLINSEEADILVLTETHGPWAEALSSLDSDYAHHVKVPLDNTYGMMLYSKYEIVKQSLKYLVNDEIPSIHVRLNVKGQPIHLMLIHPEPPLDFKRLREKDLEILMVTIEADETDIPTILCGDLNDVGWSYASRHMCQQTMLEDPRIGRGFFNTYNAHIPFFRYPIDHFFMSTKLKVVDMKVLDKCGSDHFPVSISVELPEEKVG